MVLWMACRFEAAVKQLFPSRRRCNPDRPSSQPGPLSPSITRSSAHHSAGFNRGRATCSTIPAQTTPRGPPRACLACQPTSPAQRPQLPAPSPITPGPPITAVPTAVLAARGSGCSARGRMSNSKMVRMRKCTSKSTRPRPSMGHTRSAPGESRATACARQCWKHSCGFHGRRGRGQLGAARCGSRGAGLGWLIGLESRGRMCKHVCRTATRLVFVRGGVADQLVAVVVALACGGNDGARLVNALPPTQTPAHARARWGGPLRNGAFPVQRHVTPPKQSRPRQACRGRPPSLWRAGRVV